MDELKVDARAAAGPVRLSLATLARLPAALDAPTYDRAAIRPGIVHFGVGNFHRAHMAVYLHRLMQKGLALDWGVIGAGVTSYDEAIHDALAGQDLLTTVVERDAKTTIARVTGVMIGFVDPRRREELHALLIDPAIRLVSMTITEGGYFLDARTGAFDAAHPAIRRDAAEPDAPRTVFGVLLKALKARRAAGRAPFAVMSCDNIPHNGEVTLAALVGLARLADPEFAAWAEANVATPSSMVDRITPATSDKERRQVEVDYGVVDAWPVFCETFSQWALEDRFPLGRPPFEQVGATFVDDVSAYESMKIRILNGGHAAIAYPAGILGVEMVDEAMGRPLIRRFLEKLELTEIIPGVEAPPGVDLVAYFRKVEERFANPRVGDTIRRLCFDGSNRQPKFILPSVATALAQGRSVEGLALVSALWCRYCFGIDEAGRVIEPNDPDWPRLTETARRAKEDPAVWLAMRDIYGALGEDPRFAEPFARRLRAIWRDGVAHVLLGWLAESA
jgi:mannitol 2-dehydrogenase